MDIDKLREELTVDEGCKYEIYKDHLGYPTFGIGHLVTEADPEKGMEIGTPVSEERVIEVFERDIEITLAECQKLYDDWTDLPEEVQLIVANMMFNMGLPRLSKFKGMKAGVDAKDWNKAADEMVDSRWYKQVTNRADRLVERMRALA
jgi:lysozyme|tara:strand:- start:2536 stop:2979 length:444 start_codon:yes stop_codon:yes gene_type:complete